MDWTTATTDVKQSLKRDHCRIGKPSCHGELRDCLGAQSHIADWPVAAPPKSPAAAASRGVSAWSLSEAHRRQPGIATAPRGRHNKAVESAGRMDGPGGRDHEQGVQGLAIGARGQSGGAELGGREAVGAGRRADPVLGRCPPHCDRAMARPAFRAGQRGGRRDLVGDRHRL